MKVLSKVLKVQGIILLILVVIAGIIYFTMLRYPNLKNNPTIDKWYRIETSEMKSSEGGAYHALIKKGSQNKVMVYFAGGGVSINEDTAKYDTYNTKFYKSQSPIKNEIRKIVIEALVVNELIEIIPKLRYEVS